MSMDPNVPDEDEIEEPVARDPVAQEMVDAAEPSFGRQGGLLDFGVKELVADAKAVVADAQDIVSDVRAGSLGVAGSIGPWVIAGFTIPALPFHIYLTGAKP